MVGGGGDAGGGGSESNTGSNIGTDGGKMDSKSKCLTTTAMEQLGGGGE